MKLMVMTDIEGVCGVNGKPDGAGGNQILNLPAACQALADEVNAVVEGAAAGGADEILVWDGHGNSDSLEAARLKAPAKLGMIGGPLHPVCHCDAGFDAAIQIGAHAMQGVGDGFLCHTFNSHQIVAMTMNGKPVGEIGIQAAIAAYFGVPTILVSGDAAACREAKALMPEVFTVATKTGLSRYTVINRHPADVLEELRRTAEKAVRALGDFPAPSAPGACVLRLDLMAENAAADYEMRGWERVGGNSVQTRGEDVIDVFAQFCGWAAGVHNRRYGITPRRRGIQG